MGWGMMSEYLLGDEDYGGGPSGNTGCGCVVLFAAGFGIGSFIAVKFGSELFAVVAGIF